MITLANVSKSYASKHGTVQALDNVSLHIKPAEIFGVIGYSGAGKSTLVRMINQLEIPDTGTVTVDGTVLNGISRKNLLKQRRNIGMIFQHFNLLENKTVYDNVAMPLVLAKKSRREIDARVNEVLEFVGLTEKRNQRVSRLSGGQKQRVGIARALSTRPTILLADEATSALDPHTTDSILGLLKRINQEMGVTVVVIAHQMHVIQKICHRVAVMQAGTVVETGSVLEVFATPQQPLTQHFANIVLNDELPTAMKTLLTQDERNFQVVRVRAIGADSSSTLFARLQRLPELEVNIMGGTVQELAETPVASFHAQLVGDAEAIVAGRNLLTDSGARVETVEV